RHSRHGSTGSSSRPQRIPDRDVGVATDGRAVHDGPMKQPPTAFEKKILVRPLRTADYDAIVDMQRLCVPKLDPTTREQFESQLKIFPEGQICVDHGGVPIASCSSLIVDFDLHNEWQDWMAMSDSGMIRNHVPDGDSLYGIEIMVHPKYRGMRLAR